MDIISNTDTDFKRIWNLKIDVPQTQEFIPENYYCHFLLDLKNDFIYTIEVDRYKYAK